MARATLPPGPRGHYLFKNKLDYGRDPLGFATWCSREYGDVVRLRFLTKQTYLLNHPDHIEHVLVKNNRNFIKPSRRPLRGKSMEEKFFGQGLLHSQGESWRRQRRRAQPAFQRQRIKAYGETMVSCTEQMLTTWQDGDTRDVYEEMVRLLTQIVAEVFFDAEIVGKSEEMCKALERVAKTFDERGKRGLFRSSGSSRFHEANKRLDELIYGIINERRDNDKDTEDLLSTLLRFRDEDGNRISDEQLRSELVTMFFAGSETTALTLSWAWYLLSQHPEVETKLLTELQEVLGDRAPTAEDLPRLRYAEMVVKESMRLYPPVWDIKRQAVEECEIGGYHVPAGTQLFMSQWVVQRDPRYFENPEAFVPDRWEDGFAERIPKYAYFPFGAGPRLCIGGSLAMMQATLLLATIANKFRLVSGQQAIPQPSITLRPKGGMSMVLEERP